MRSLVVMTLAAVGCLLTFGGERAWAQGVPRPGMSYNQITNPPYSPYLNLLRPGSFTGNYWGLVQPELQWRNSVQGLDQQVLNNSQAIGGLQANQAAQNMPATGHSTRFLNTGGYFLSGGGRGGRR